MFGNVRERLSMVQHDFTAGFKTIGDKTKDPRMKRRPQVEETLPHFSAGLEILSRYEDSWFLLHKRTKDCAQAAEAVEGDMVMLSAHCEKRRAAVTQLQDLLYGLPAFMTELDAVTTLIAHLEGDFEEMASRLEYLETLCCHCEQQTLKQHHNNQLQLYKNKKRKEIEALQVELDCEHAQKQAELEQAMQQKLKERQKIYEEAFHQDMEQYRSTGHVQHREVSGADVCVLDQMTLTNVLDQEALDDFLNSSSDDVSTGSSLTSGPDIDSSESPRSPLSQAPPTCSQEAAVEQEGEEEDVVSLVQGDEEDVDPDMLLAVLQDAGGSDTSDEE
ncbi:dysbindin-A-like isoform X1 [Thalassophryne amazonica]|uniref:dysbindin-A-like isoform X1 n=1 Tax=Thalassophryne amazonica TaxID=390379 RepID=UPI001470D259|nr:dysbindin-A-like isoform X1 [Thalassophryne amazonica]